MTKEIFVLLFFTILPTAGGLTCLQCNNVPAPKHCTTVTKCFEGEVCGVERIYSEFGSELFNVGCMLNDKCSSSSGGQRCVECCNTTLCNAAGCGETGYTSIRGPVCYSCPVHSAAKPCHTIDFCGLGEKCFFEAKREFGEIIYSTKCLDSHACREGVFVTNAIVGRDLDTSRFPTDSDRRSIVENVCRSCCDFDVCNLGCNTSVIDPTAAMTTATQCKPDRCVHGRCYNGLGDIVCVCDHGYEGTFCNISILTITPATHCIPDPCEHGRCYEVGQDFVCVCDHGYEGRTCNLSTIQFTYCEPNPCKQGRCYTGDGDFVCVCEHGYEGRFCNTFSMSYNVSDCYDILHKNLSKGSGVYKVRLWKTHREIDVYCDMDTDGGGWTVFQSRFNGSVDFYRNFSEYENGFGSLYGEFWLGLTYVQEMAAQNRTDLRLDLTAANGSRAFEVFQNFRLGPNNYTLHIDRGTGTAGDDGDGLSYNNGYVFSTYDRDNEHQCAYNKHGAWWFSFCTHVHLNGKYTPPGTWISEAGIIYRGFTSDISLKATQMKFRRV